MPETVTVTKDGLRAAMLHWENQSRHPNALTRQEMLLLSPDAVAQLNVDYLWPILQQSEVRA